MEKKKVDCGQRIMQMAGKERVLPVLYQFFEMSGQQKGRGGAGWKTTRFPICRKTLTTSMPPMKCQFCRGDEKPGKMRMDMPSFEMAHPEPYAEKRHDFRAGKKVRTPVGSLVTIQASIGKRMQKMRSARCRRFAEMGLIGFSRGGLCSLMIPSIWAGRMNWMAFMPLYGAWR